MELLTLCAVVLVLAIANLPLGAITHTVTRAWSNGANAISKAQAISGEGEDNRDVAIPASTTDKEVNVVFVRARLNSLYVVADGDCTLETNSGSSPGNTFSLKANVPLIWTENSGVAVTDFLAADVTAFYFTNAGGSTVNVQIRILKDATP